MQSLPAQISPYSLWQSNAWWSGLTWEQQEYIRSWYRIHTIWSPKIGMSDLKVHHAYINRDTFRSQSDFPPSVLRTV